MACGVSVLLGLLAGLSAQSNQPPVDFAKQVQPVLEKSCYGCHGPKAQMGNLRLDSKAAAFNGGLSGKVIVVGNGEGSLLYRRISGLGDQARMPMGGKPLAPAEIAIIKLWIDQGAVWPDGVGATTAAIQKHWAFIPPKTPPVPAASMKGWVRNPIDNFVLARLDKEGLKPSEEADRTTLLRRLSLDLIGLPPTPVEVEAFLKDKSKDAYQKQARHL